MNKTPEEILEILKQELFTMVLEENRFSYFPPVRGSLELEAEITIYDLMKFSESEEEARYYLKKVVELLGEYYEFPPEIDGEYYPEYYIGYFKNLKK